MVERNCFNRSLKRFVVISIISIFACLLVPGNGFGDTPDEVSVAGITNPSAANGKYIKQSGTLGCYGHEYWKHETDEYYMYSDRWGSGSTGDNYWNIDNDTDDENNALFISNIYVTDDAEFANLVSPDLVGNNWGTLDGTGAPTVTLPDLPEINVIGNENNIDDEDDTPSFNQHTRFGSAERSSGTLSRTFTIENEGSAALSISGVTITGDDAEDFSVSVSPAASVAASGTTSFEITFSPSSTGDLTAEVVISNDDSNEAEYNFTIEGYGFIQGDLEVSNIRDTGGDSHAANGTYEYQGVLNRFRYWKHESYDYYVYNDEYSNGSITWNIDVDTDDTDTDYLFYKESEDGSPQGLAGWTAVSGVHADYQPIIAESGVTYVEIQLSGNGVSISDGDGTPCMADGTSFGTLDISSASTSRQRTFTIENKGNADLTISDIAISGTDADDFSVSTGPDGTVSGGGTTTFIVEFEPTATGEKTATISIANDDDDEGTYTFAINGYGVTPNDLIVSAIGGLTDANGTYTYLGILNEFQYWQNGSYYIYNDDWSGERYWNIDVDTDDTDDDSLFFKSSEAVNPTGLTAWTVNPENTEVSGQPVITFLNSAPGITVSDGTYTENGAATAIDTSATAADADGDSDWDTGAKLEVQITANNESDDEISIDMSGNFSISASTLSYSGIGVVGSISESSGTVNDGVVTNGDVLTINFSSNATNAVVQELVQAIAYRSTSDTPTASAATRTVALTLSDKNGGSGADTAAITITAVNDPPAVATNTGASLNEGATHTITTSELNEGDPDDSGTGLTCTVTSGVSNGTLFVDPNSNDIADDASEIITVGETFTQDDIDNSRLKYVHDGSETTSDSFVFSLADGGEDGASAVTGQTFSFVITPVNDSPTVAVNTGSSLDEGATDVITTSELNEGDPDDSGTGLTYTVTTATATGTLWVDSDDSGSVNGSESAIADNGTFTQDDIDNSRLKYAHDGSETTSDSFVFSLADGGEDGASAVTGQTFTFSITGLDDAPMIDGQVDLHTAKGTSLTITLDDLTVTDPDNTFPDDFTLSVQDGADYTRSGNTITPVAGFSGDLTVPVTVNDGTNDSNVYNLSVYVATERAVANTDDSGVGSLRQALADAGEGDVIDLSGVTGTITLTSGRLTIDKDVEIVGSEEDGIVIDGNGADRVLDIASGVVVGISDATVSNGVVAEAGGGINNAGNLTLIRVTVSGNAGTNGAGIYNAGSLTMKNSTVSGNIASMEAGGIYNEADCVLTLNNCTVAGNNTTGSIGGLLTSGTLNISNTLIADNSPSDFGGSGTVATNTANLVEDGSLTGADFGDPGLGPLQDNGGSGYTHGLAYGSIAIDAGDAGTAEAEDQRGNVRPVDGDANGAALPDIGAFECSPGVIEFSASTYSVSEDGGGITITVNRTGTGDGAASATYATSDGTATAGSDYTSASGTLTWSSGDTSAKTFSISIDDDLAEEGDESVSLALDTITGAGAGSIVTAGLTIADNDVYYTLTTTVDGEGAGSITGFPSGIDCGSDCSATYYSGTTVTLIATADDECSVFSGWSGGGCTGTESCIIDLTADTAVTAVFDLSDTDGDGAPDCDDVFPADPDEWADGDNDGIGDNADTDHDNDGMPTEWENANGLDPYADDAGQDPDGDGLSNLEEYETGTDPQTTTAVLGTAVLVSPSDGTVDQSVIPTLETTYGDGTDESVHAGTRWQIASDVSFGDVLLDITSDDYIIRLTVPAGVLDPYRTYFWRARYVDSDDIAWPWSESWTFTTTDVYYTLATTAGGEGSGNIKSSPSGIDCGSDCSAAYHAGTTVTLTAGADDCSVFSGWSGQCTGTGPCTIELTADTVVTAVFGLPDTDADGVTDCGDAFPADPDEWADGDHDGIGDNADTDHDNDGMPTDWEIVNGLDPYTDDADRDPDNDGLSNLEEYETGSNPLSKTTGLARAVLAAPADGATGQSTTPTLETSYGDDADASAHFETRWQIASDAEFSDVLMDITSAIHITDLTVSAGILDPSLAYFWRARYVDTDSTVWPWSESWRFETTQEIADDNGNGLPDDQELPEGTESDLNGDGTDDLSEADMHCVTFFDGSGWTCLEEETGSSIEEFFAIDVEEIPESDGQPDELPYGLFGFRLVLDTPGDSVTVTKYYSEALPENISWYKYDSVNGWFDYTGYVTFNEDRTAAIIELTDGGYGDADGVANGVIVDPSGPAAFLESNTDDESVVDDPETTASGSDNNGDGCFITTATDGGIGLWGLLAFIAGCMGILSRSKNIERTRE